MKYQYTFKVDNSEYCGIFTYATHISEVKLSEDIDEVHEFLETTEAFEDAVQYVRELVEDEVESFTEEDVDEEEMASMSDDVMYYIETGSIEIEEVE